VETLPVTGAQFGTASVDCPDGEIALGGGHNLFGFSTADAANRATIVNSSPTGNPPTSWEVDVINYGPGDVFIAAVVICASVSP
jgi:hypothetical protein